MFTGIIEEVGIVKSIINRGDALKLTIIAEKTVKNIRPGDSISVNGVCLTVTSFTDTEFLVDVSPETFRITNLKFLKPHSKVNLEPALTLSKPLGGHIVSGHIDATAKIISVSNIKNFLKMSFEIPYNLRKYMVEKGSIAIDGISLTINELNDNVFNVMIIPHTLLNTTLPEKKEGDWVNIETDIISKYIENFVSVYNKEAKGITGEFLAKHGFYK